MCTACKPLDGTSPGHTVNEKESEEGQEQRADRAIWRQIEEYFHLMYTLFLTFGLPFS